jgi:hypothetical protein
MNISGHAEVGRIDDFICAWVVQDGLGMDASLVGEGAETGNRVVKWCVDLNSLGNHILNLLNVSCHPDLN